jgi:hypothetical protein
MVGWWMMGWVTLRLQTEIPFSTLFIWIVATALLYLAGLSAVGAALNSERDRAFHLLAWLAVLALVIGQSALTIG